MASFFGEIIEPSTRAIFDDFSDDEETTTDTKLQLSWVNADNKLPAFFDVIFVINGRLSLAFSEAYLLDEKSILTAEINIIENNSDLDKEVDDSHMKILPSRIFTDKRMALCFVSPSYSSDLGYQFTQTILPFLNISKKIIVICDESVYNYKAPSLNDVPAAFIKELKTSYNNSKDAAEKLPIPNFITGIPAAVISWCQIFKKDGSAFVCYSDQPKLDSITASPYLSVIRKLGYDIIKNKNPNFGKRLFYGKPEAIGASSNMYI